MMRLLILIFLLVSFSLGAQTQQDPVFTLKPALGLNACQIHGDNYDGYDKAGIFGGIAVNARLSPKISLELGFYFSQKGARHNPNPDKGDYSYYRVNLNYIDLPLLFRYRLNPAYFITAGPSIAYLVNYQEDTERGNWNGVYPFNKFEVGLNAGLGRKLGEKFTVEVRTSNSITSIRDYGNNLISHVFYPNPVARFFNKGFYNNILTLIVSYNLNGKRRTSTEEPKQP